MIDEVATEDVAEEVTVEEVTDAVVTAEEATDEESAAERQEDDLLVLESVDEPWELPVWEPTGEERVDEALEGLSRIDLDDVHTHAAAYTEIHQRLRDTLSDLDASS